MTTANPSRSGPGHRPGHPSQQISRRHFIRVSTAATLVSAVGLPLLVSACAPQAPTAPAGAKPSAGGPVAAPPAPAKPGDRAASVFPTYVPFTGGAKPDYHLDDPLYSDGYETYPISSFKAIAETPGAGGTVNVLIASYFPTPTLYDQNPTWQEVNKRLGANVQMNLVPGADY